MKLDSKHVTIYTYTLELSAEERAELVDLLRMAQREAGQNADIKTSNRISRYMEVLLP